MHNIPSFDHFPSLPWISSDVLPIRVEMVVSVVSFAFDVAAAVATGVAVAASHSVTLPLTMTHDA